jgi:transcriptional regulator with XRE-family HTH domain
MVQATTPGTLRAVRLNQGKSLRTVAQQADLDPGALSKIETGKRIPRTDTLRRICAALGLTKAEEILATFAMDQGEMEASGDPGEGGPA